MNSKINISNKFKTAKQVTELNLEKFEGGRGKEEHLLLEALKINHGAFRWNVEGLCL